MNQGPFRPCQACLVCVCQSSVLFCNKDMSTTFAQHKRVADCVLPHIGPQLRWYTCPPELTQRGIPLHDGPVGHDLAFPVIDGLLDPFLALESSLLQRFAPLLLCQSVHRQDSKQAEPINSQARRGAADSLYSPATRLSFIICSQSAICFRSSARGLGGKNVGRVLLMTLSSILGPMDLAFCLRKVEVTGGPAI